MGFSGHAGASLIWAVEVTPDELEHARRLWIGDRLVYLDTGFG